MSWVTVCVQDRVTKGTELQAQVVEYLSMNYLGEDWDQNMHLYLVFRSSPQLVGMGPRLYSFDVALVRMIEVSYNCFLLALNHSAMVSGN